jgi:hypothetical protein
MSKTALTTLIVAIIIVLGAVFFLTGDRNTNASQGSLVVGITDQTANMQGVSEVRMTVSGVEAYNQTEGWVNVMNERKTYELLDLNTSGRVAYYTRVKIDEGSYEQLKLRIGDVTVLYNGREVQARLPSNEIIINGNVNIKNGETTYVEFDVIASDSLHRTANGQFVFTPVVELRSAANATITVENDTVIVSGGTPVSSGRFGMDVDGQMKSNFMIGTDARLNIGSSGVIEIIGGSRGTTTATSSVNINATSSGNINSSTSSTNVNVNGGLRLNR